MKRFSDMAQEVTNAAKRARGPAPGGQGMESDAAPASPPRRPLSCAGVGCLLAGAISEGTRGEGPWWCRFHFWPDGLTEEQISTRLRNRMAAGQPLEMPQPPSATVAAFRDLLRPRPE